MSDTLEKGEWHPISGRVLDYINSFNIDELLILKNSINKIKHESGCSDKVTDVCMGTLDRIINGEPVSDLYLLGLAWFLMEIVMLQDQLLEEEENEYIPTIDITARTH
jgi:hypothetical protein